MDHYMQQRQPPTVHTTTSDAVAREVKHPAIDLNLPAQDDPVDNQDPNSSVSNGKSIVSVGRSSTPPLLFDSDGLMELGEGDKIYHLIREKLFSRLAALGAHVTLVAIHQNCYSSVSAKGRAQAFQLYSHAVQIKSGDSTANIKFAWYATSKEEAFKILSHGFGYKGKLENNGSYGCGIYFDPYDHPLESVMSAPVDEDGLRHLLLCRVILGKSELVTPGSKQSHPSSEQYDSGLDDLSSPRRYIIWSTHMNTHALPEYIVSFRAPRCLRGFLTTPGELLRLTLPWIPFPVMIYELSKILPPSQVSLISKYHQDFKEKKIPKHELILKFRQIAGDRLLREIFESFRTKNTAAQGSGTHNVGEEVHPES